ncbi:MAG TPA: HD domain-containing protein [Chloroflexia bacterium]|nr:HD domain-containing protein [Chloroflexia bacterium]
MTVPDRLWGEITLDEPVLEELARSGPVQRLRGIHQSGASYYLFPDRKPSTRYEHSLGVMHLLRLLGASLEERVAGLLHDVPHTAFSHTADVLFPNEEHNFHERFQHEIVMGSDVPAILERQGLPLRAGLEPEAYTLLEKPLPGLCADRLDYALRDSVTAKLATVEEARAFADTLRVHDGEIVVGDLGAAEWFGRLYAVANAELWSAPSEAGSYWALAGAIRRAYDIGGFTDADLFSTDDEAMSKLRALDDPKVEAYLALLVPGTEFIVVGEGEPHFKTAMKYRRVDPPVLESSRDTPVPLSSLSEEHADYLRSGPSGETVRYRLWSPSITMDMAWLLDLAVRPRI